MLHCHVWKKRDKIISCEQTRWGRRNGATSMDGDVNCVVHRCYKAERTMVMCTSPAYRVGYNRSKRYGWIVRPLKIRACAKKKWNAWIIAAEMREISLSCAAFCWNLSRVRCILMKIVSCALHDWPFYKSWAPCEQIYVVTYVHELIWRPSVAYK